MTSYPDRNSCNPVLFHIWLLWLGRIRGLVNFRTEPLSVFTPGKNRCANGRIRAPHDGFQHRTGEADNINQIDADQGGGNGWYIELIDFFNFLYK
jgi:hypothetical protein